MPYDPARHGPRRIVGPNAAVHALGGRGRPRDHGFAALDTRLDLGLRIVE